MTRDEILSQLEKLIQLDVDATHAYDQAIKNVDDQPIKDKLILFQGDHRRHIDLLSAKQKVVFEKFLLPLLDPAHQ